MSRTKDILKFSISIVAISVILPVLFILIQILLPKKDPDLSFEQISLRFKIHNTDSTHVISFGDLNTPSLSNRIEVYQNSSVPMELFWIIIDNTDGQMKVEKMIFYPNRYFTYTVPDFDHTIYMHAPFDSGHIAINEINRDMGKKFRLISDNGRLSGKDRADNPLPRNHILSSVEIAPYGRTIQYRMYDLGQKEDIVSYLSALAETSDVIRFSELSSKNISTDYTDNNNNNLYKNQQEQVYVITPDNKRNFMAYGQWLFLDTMKIEGELKLKKVIWSADSYELAVFYRLNNDNMIPVNGACYKKYVRQLDDLYFE